MSRYFYVLALLIVGSACTSTLTPRQSNNSPITSYSEDISYLMPSFNEKERDVADTDNLMEDAQEIDITSDKKIVDNLQAKIIEENKSFSNSYGYRIQVFSGNSRADFQNAKAYILRNHPELEVYESYSHPTYRIRTGDFIHLQDAIRYNSLLKNRFGATRVLNEKINLKKAFNIK